MNPKYTKDENGKELLTITEKHDNIMMEWEKPYMEACIDKLQPKGDVLEIGFGNGELLASMANENNQSNFIGIEVYDAGVGHCLNLIDERKIKNLKIINGDAVEVLRFGIVDASISEINLIFPRCSFKNNYVAAHLRTRGLGWRRTVALGLWLRTYG